jgi:hypothetical protein
MGFHTFDADRAEKLEDEARYRYLSREELVDAVEPDPDEVLADLGSGTGFYTDDVAPFVGAIRAVDLQRAMHDRYREKGPPENVSLVTADVADLPFADAELDGAFSTMTFHEFASETALSEVARVLRPGGSSSPTGRPRATGRAGRRSPSGTTAKRSSNCSTPPDSTCSGRTSDPRPFSRSRRGSSGPSTRPIGRSIDRFCGVLPVVGTTPSFPLSCDGWSFASDSSSRNVTPRFPLFRSSPALFEPPPRTASGRRLPMVTLTVPTPTRSDGLRRSNSKKEVIGRPLPTGSVTPPFPVFCGSDIRWSAVPTSGGLRYGIRWFATHVGAIK